MDLSCTSPSWARSRSLQGHQNDKEQEVSLTASILGYTIDVLNSIQNQKQVAMRLLGDTSEVLQQAFHFLSHLEGRGLLPTEG